jgi:hypothetical protein
MGKEKKRKQRKKGKRGRRCWEPGNAERDFTGVSSVARHGGAATLLLSLQGEGRRIPGRWIEG